jgi:CheY-like chemotaxis protein
MPEKILIVDDEQDGVSFISSVLDDNGYDYISANNGNTGLELATSEKPDLILLDLIMPEKSGIMMFQELKKDPELRKIPIVIVSGASEVTGVDFKNFIFKQPVRKEDATESEASEPAHYFTPDGFVEKPINPEELIKAIQAALKK